MQPSFQPPGFEIKTFSTSLGRLVYYTNSALQGRSPRGTLVFLHNFGGGASAYEWSKVYPAFATEYRIVAPDLIGWGQSEHPVRDYQSEDYLRVLREFLDELGEVPVGIMAASLPAALVVRLAIQRPDLSQFLFLVCPAGFDDFGQGSGRRLPLGVIRFPGLSQGIYQLGAGNGWAVRSFLERFLFANPQRLTNEMVAAYLASAQQPHADLSALAFLRGELSFDLAQYLPQLTIPTVMVWGEQAQLTPLTLGERLARLNPQVVQGFHKIPDAGVLPQLEQPAVVIGLLQKYLVRFERTE